MASGIYPSFMRMRCDRLPCSLVAEFINPHPQNYVNVQLYVGNYDKVVKCRHSATKARLRHGIKDNPKHKP